jgi:hypothetical protein
MAGCLSGLRLGVELLGHCGLAFDCPLVVDRPYQAAALAPLLEVTASRVLRNSHAIPQRWSAIVCRAITATSFHRPGDAPSILMTGAPGKADAALTLTVGRLLVGRSS